MRRVCAVYFALGLGLWPVPLLNVLQAEAAALVALVAFFVSGIAAVGQFEQRDASVWPVLGQHEAALLIPLGMLTIAQLWAPNCTFGQGLLFYGLFPGITVVFSVALAYALQGLNLFRPRLVLAGIGGLLIVGGPLYDLGLHPQFYTYNHVFGGILGPIYDEQLAVRSGLFVFRGLTLLWAGAALLFGLRLRGRGPRWALPLCAIAIGGIYVFAGPLGINTPAGYLQEQLGGHERTAHFDIYYDPETLEGAALDDLVAAHEHRYAWLRDRLSVDSSEAPSRIQSYIYPSPEVKGQLTGARTTSVSPVWLAQPQVHLLRNRVSSSLGHELAHVFSRTYGLPGVRASWAPGLVEGWAVALEPPSPGPTPDDLVLTAAASDTTEGLSSTAAALTGRLSPWGFWTGRGAVSYATMGSFVRFLLDEYGAERLKQVYAWGNFRAVYGEPLHSLANEWAVHLARRPAVAASAHDVVARTFTRPSLFEVECPHYVPPHRQHYQVAERAARRRDTTQMQTHLQKSLLHEPRYAAAHQALARLRLSRGEAEAVRQQLDTLSEETRTVGIQVALADARALQGKVDSARALYAGALSETPSYAHETRARLFLRDAVADRSTVVRVLVSGDSAQVQARRLAALEDTGAAVKAVRGLRWMDARAYSNALSIWRDELMPVRSERPRGWRREWRVQQWAWGSQAAERAGARAMAQRLAERAAHRARELGAYSRATLFDWWADRTSSPDPPGKSIQPEAKKRAVDDGEKNVEPRSPSPG